MSTPVPLNHEQVMQFSGRVIWKSIQFAKIGDLEILVVGNTEGDLSAYILGEDQPVLSASELGTLCCLKVTWLSFLGEVGVVACTLEGYCHIFKLGLPFSRNTPWLPFATQSIVMNSQCLIVEDFENHGKTCMLLGTSFGLLAYYRPTSKPDKKFAWAIPRTWNLVTDITSLTFCSSQDKNLLFIGSGDGSVLSLRFPNAENPERASSKNLLTDICGGNNIYTIVNHEPTTGAIAAANGNGKVCILSSVNSTEKYTEVSDYYVKEISKRPILVDFLNFPEKTLVVGASDGCIYFLSETVNNYFRYEEVPQTYCVANFERPILGIVNSGGNIVIYRDFQFLSNKLSNFIDYSKTEVEELREILNDKETPPEELIMTYLYMPLR
mgnify:FL=1